MAPASASAGVLREVVARASAFLGSPRPGATPPGERAEAVPPPGSGGSREPRRRRSRASPAAAPACEDPFAFDDDEAFWSEASALVAAAEAKTAPAAAAAPGSFAGALGLAPSFRTAAAPRPQHSHVLENGRFVRVPARPATPTKPRDAPAAAAAAPASPPAAPRAPPPSPATPRAAPPPLPALELPRAAANDAAAAANDAAAWTALLEENASLAEENRSLRDEVAALRGLPAAAASPRGSAAASPRGPPASPRWAYGADDAAADGDAGGRGAPFAADLASRLEHLVDAARVLRTPSSQVSDAPSTAISSLTAGSTARVASEVSPSPSKSSKSRPRAKKREAKKRAPGADDAPWRGVSDASSSAASAASSDRPRRACATDKKDYRCTAFDARVDAALLASALGAMPPPPPRPL